MPETAWEKTKKYSGTAYTKALKPGFDKVYYTVDKLGKPINHLSNKLGAEAFWPTSLDKESDKAARILQSFCKDGFYANVDAAQAERVAASGEKVEGPQGQQRVLKKIPEKVIREAKGLAIFTTMRTGLWLSGAGGSGILVARIPETGEWSPPSGIMLHTAGLGFLVGVDIYDCVVVINTYKALEAFTKIRCTLGGEVSAVAGPVGLGGVLETELHKRQAPIWTYLKSRGFYAGVQVDGTIVIARTDENETFYGERIGVADILAGKARHPPETNYRMLLETIKAAQGDKVDDKELPCPGLAPGDLYLNTETGHFGIPDVEDPDPYGVKALQAEGFEIREAGTKSKPSPDVFDFKPATTSPIYPTYRKSVEFRDRANSWRGSMHSIASVDKATQTDEDATTTTATPWSVGVPSPIKRISQPSSPIRKETEHVQDSSDDDNNGRPDEMDAPVKEPSSRTVETAIPVVARARMVTVPKRVPPSLPPRNPNRMSPLRKHDGDADDDDDDGFDNVSLTGSEHSATTLEKRKSSIESEISQAAGTAADAAATRDEKIPANANGVHGPHGVAAEDEFHSVPPSPTKEHHQVPGAF